MLAYVGIYADGAASDVFDSFIPLLNPTFFRHRRGARTFEPTRAEATEVQTSFHAVALNVFQPQLCTKHHVHAMKLQYTTWAGWSGLPGKSTTS